MTDTKKLYQQASMKTVSDLKKMAYSIIHTTALSELTLPEVEEVVELVGRIVPAGNVPGVILNGMARLAGRRPSRKNIKRDINLLFKGVQQTIDKAVYGTFFAGPAAVIWGYQNLLTLAGKNPEDAFPEGTWQFYVDYALREDTARHVNETHGFDAVLNEHDIELNPVDRITAWVMTAIHALHRYDDLLENEWRERVYIHLLQVVTQHEPDARRYVQLYRRWERKRPYKRGDDVKSGETYPVYRRRKFDEFLQKAIIYLSDDLNRKWHESIEKTTQEALPAYQKQMSILAYLEPHTYQENRIPISLEETCVGLIYRHEYYLIPTCQPHSHEPADVTTIRNHVASIVNAESRSHAVNLTHVARMKRTEWSRLRKKLSKDTIATLDKLHHAPILLNCDRRSHGLPLAEIRQAERGIGDHALTIFDTGKTFAFDQSHIFFDGAWGSGLAEILTNEALSWAVYLNSLPSVVKASFDAPSSMTALHVDFTADEWNLIKEARHVSLEVSVETDATKISPILKLRRLFKQRNDLIELTVNDILVLYRAIHAATYRPAPKLRAELEALGNDDATQKAAQSALNVMTHTAEINPPILIPVDASKRSPRDRVYPMSFDVPLAELDFLNLHRQAIECLDSYKNYDGDRTELYRKFDEVQRLYLATLAGFGAVMTRAKVIAHAGESGSVGTIKLLAHMPTPLQRMLDDIPGRFEVLNDIIKGREIFSNVGAVVPSSTLTRFITAKDDNEKKTLAWGVITTADHVMRISLRDFRPHVPLLSAIGRKDLAIRIAKDYLETYAIGLNRFIHDLHRITKTSRETKFVKIGAKP